MSYNNFYMRDLEIATKLINPGDKDNWYSDDSTADLKDDLIPSPYNAGLWNPDIIYKKSSEESLHIIWQMYVPIENVAQLKQAFSETKAALHELGIIVGEDYSIVGMLYENNLTEEEYIFFLYAVDKSFIEYKHSYVYDGNHITFDVNGENLTFVFEPYNGPVWDYAAKLDSLYTETLAKPDLYKEFAQHCVEYYEKVIEMVSTDSSKQNYYQKMKLYLKDLKEDNYARNG